MAKGRPTTSDASKIAAGTYRPGTSSSRRLARSAASNFHLAVTPPVGLTKEAREAWLLAIQCAPKGSLLATDISVLERWARNYALYRKIAKDLAHQGVTITTVKPDGSEIAIENPLFKALVRIQGVLSKCETELGFTPASRARVNVDSKDEQVNDFDGF